MTIVEMLAKNAKLFPEKTAIIYKKSRISYQEFYERSNVLANLLVGIGLKKGESVGLLLQKTPEAFVSFLGVATAGGVVFPIDYNQTLADMQFILELTHPSVLIVAEDFQPLLSRLRIPCSDKKIIVIGKKLRNQYLTWEKIFTEETFDSPDVEIQDSDIVYLNFTSGTTGTPKAAITTHANIYWNTLSSVESLKLRHEDIHLCMFPVFGHPHELFARPLFLGGTIVLVDNISPKSIVRAISDHHVTCMMAVASIYETLIRFRKSSSFDFSSLRVPESGGMHVNPTLVRKFAERFQIPILPVWGSTETTGIALANSIDGIYKPGSMGKPCPYYEIRIVGEDGKELARNEIGQMAVKGPAVCSGYFGNTEETEKYMKDGWFLTSDLVKRDSEDYFYFAGRKTGMMKVAGLKVFPTEIENILSGHPEIAEVAVVKARDRSHGEVPKAVIVLKECAEINRSDIRKYCEKRMSKYKVPRVIEFVTELPKTPGGKISYRKL
jgi:acyl-CoA synthetase (AMP-forming)/AMP-acid ligase II